MKASQRPSSHGRQVWHYGDRVQLDMRGGSAGATRIYIRAYLPKPAPDPTGEVAMVRAAAGAKAVATRARGSSGSQRYPAVNRAIAEKYFPDLYTYTTPKNESIADFWCCWIAGKSAGDGCRYSGSRGI